MSKNLNIVYREHLSPLKSILELYNQLKILKPAVGVKGFFVRFLHGVKICLSYQQNGLIIKLFFPLKKLSNANTAHYSPETFFSQHILDSTF